MESWWMPKLIKDNLHINLLAKYLMEADMRILVGCITWSFGHQAIDPAVYLAKKKLNPEKYHAGKDIFLRYHHFANTFFPKLFAEDISTAYDDNINNLLYSCAMKYPNLEFRIDIMCRQTLGMPGSKTPIEKFNLLVTGNKIFYSTLDKYEDRFNAPVISMPERYKAQSDMVLNLLGLHDDEWFVVIHGAEPSKAYSYHLNRRFDFSHYLDMAEYITAKGGTVLRLADASSPPLQTKNKKIIDYAHWPFRSDFSDICIMDRCRYMVNAASGPAHVTQVMSKPSIFCNVFPARSLQPRANNIMMHIKYREKATNKLISYREMLEREVTLKEFQTLNWPDKKEFYDEYEIIPNNPDELCAAVDEMHQLLEGPERSRTREQQCVRDIFPPKLFVARGEISQAYLEKNPYLLD